MPPTIALLITVVNWMTIWPLLFALAENC